MKKYSLFILQVLFSTLILITGFFEIISTSVFSILSIAAFCILIFDLIYDALLSVINLRFVNNSIYICIGTIVLIFIENINEALISLLILRIFKFILDSLIFSFERNIDRLLCKLIKTDYSNLKPGDTLTINPSEILPTDCILLNSSGLFSPVFSSPGSKPVEFLQGDDIPGGFRLVSEEPVSLHITTHYDESTFIKYLTSLKSSMAASSKNNKIATFLSGLLLITGLAATVFCLIAPGITSYSAMLVLLMCCVFLPSANILCFFSKLLFYFFQRGIIPADNINKLIKTKAFFISKTTIVKPGEYIVIDICPTPKSSMTKEMLLEYVARAELPYSHTGIGSTLLRESGKNVLLSKVKHTEKQAGMGIITQYNNDTIHAGCKEFMQASSINKLPDFSETEINATLNDTFIYVALNSSYIGYIHLHTTFKGSYSEFLKYTHKHHITAEMITHNSTEENDKLIAVKQKFQKKHRTHHVAYIDCKPTDNALQSMSDYNIFLGFSAYCPENNFTDVTIIPSSFNSLLKAIKLSKRISFDVIVYTLIFIAIKVLLIIAGFIIPGFKIWYALLADGIICVALIKVYDIFFRLFTRLN